MKRRNFVASLAAVAATAWLGLAVPAQAEEEFIYGRQLMTEQELAEHRAHMRSLKTRQEREAYRLEQHKLMQERARERGVTLPEDPGSYGRGMGPRDGSGMGPGGMQGGRMGTP